MPSLMGFCFPTGASSIGLAAFLAGRVCVDEVPELSHQVPEEWEVESLERFPP